MRRSILSCQHLLRPSWQRLPRASVTRHPYSLSVCRFSTASSSSSSSSSSTPHSSPPDLRSTDPSLYSSSHLPTSIQQHTSGQSQHPPHHVPYVAYSSEYEENNEPTDDSEQPAAAASSTPPSFSSTSASTPSSATTSTSPTDSDSSMVSAINQLTIEGLRNESATGPATINTKPLHAKYKPTSRKAATHRITPTTGTLTTLQLHRLLSLYAVAGGSEVREQQRVVERLAGRFGVDVGKVEQLVQAMAVGRVYDEAAGRGGANPGELGEDKYAVWRADEVPPGRRVVVQGAHLVNHLQAWERDNGGSGKQ